MYPDNTHKCNTPVRIHRNGDLLAFIQGVTA